ncbi:hypothetical protein AC249_AIPGENE232, partial [Exaiptasia diaphana]
MGGFCFFKCALSEVSIFNGSSEKHGIRWGILGCLVGIFLFLKSLKPATKPPELETAPAARPLDTPITKPSESETARTTLPEPQAASSTSSEPEPANADVSSGEIPEQGTDPEARTDPFSWGALAAKANVFLTQTANTLSIVGFLILSGTLAFSSKGPPPTAPQESQGPQIQRTENPQSGVNERGTAPLDSQDFGLLNPRSRISLDAALKFRRGLSAKDQEKALEYLKDAIEFAEDDASQEALARLFLLEGQLLLDLQRYREAVVSLERAAELGEESRELLLFAYRKARQTANPENEGDLPVGTDESPRENRPQGSTNVIEDYEMPQERNGADLEAVPPGLPDPSLKSEGADGKLPSAG